MIEIALRNNIIKVPELSRDELIDTLKTKVADVIFEKKDGTLGIIRGTLRPDLLPVKNNSNAFTKAAVSATALPVFNVDKQAWRSFRIKSIKQLLIHAD